MAQSIGNYALNKAHVGERASLALWKLRLAPGWTMLCAAVVGLFALSWDIQWHTAVGRDRTLTAPHLFILGSVAVLGLAALATVLSETLWARHNPMVARSGTIFAGLFSSSLGVYLVGYGALDAAVAFPLDQYWHTLYGIDITIWAPFHIMSIIGFCVSCLGIAEMLATGAHLAEQQGAKAAARGGYTGVILALATLMGLLSVLLPNALSHDSFITIGSLAFSVFPLMFGAFGMFVLIIAIRALPWRAAATSVALVYVLWGLINFPLIPQLMTWLLGIEQQSLRANAPAVAVLGVEWQYGLIIAAVLLDSMVWIGQRRGWSLKKQARLLLVVGMAGMSMAALAFPSFLASAWKMGSSRIAIQGHKAASGVIVTRVAVPGSSYNSIVIVAVSLLLGLLGVYLGNWFSTSIGETMRRKA